MKKSGFLLSALCALSIGLAACSDDDYPSNVADAIPDGEFRVLCLYIADTDRDGVISREEALAVTRINCMPDASHAETMSSLEGLHYFTNLETLDCSRQRLTSLDVSGNPRLRQLYCSYNPLAALDVSGCMELETLLCGSCELGRLQLPRTATLKELHCGFNRLASLDVNGCPALKGLTCEENLFSELNVDACLGLMMLACTCKVTSDMSRHVQLLKFCCEGLTCDRLDLSGHKILRELSITHGRIREIVFGNSDWLERLTLNDVNCTSLDLSGCSQLGYLTLAEMPLSELKLGGELKISAKFSKLSLERLEVKVPLEKTPKLEVCDCDRLQRIDVSGRVRDFTCRNCPNLTTLNLKLRNMGSFQCTGTALASLDFSQYDRLYDELDCSDNRLTKLVLPSSLYSLRCSGNLLEELDISKCSVVQSLEWRPMETLKRIRLRREQQWNLGDTKGIELVYVD